MKNTLSNSYLSHLQANKEIAKEYYKKSIVKTEQQKFLEKILKENNVEIKTAADIACGGGTLSFHLSNLYPGAEFYLSDLNSNAIEIAKEICDGKQFHFSQDDVYDLGKLPQNYFDGVFCWQTLLCLNQPHVAVHEMLELVRPGGRLYLSALFNLNHDVDIYAEVKDHTRKGNEPFFYNTYSKICVDEWLSGRVEQYQFYPFTPNIDFTYEGRGLGTHTVMAESNRLQLSGGLLMNWAILEIIK